MKLPTRALSIRQPWLDAIMRGGKRIENRSWKNSHVRGPILLHAAKGMTRREVSDAKNFVRARGIDVVVTPKRTTWYPPSPEFLARGGIVGMAEIVGVIFPDARHHTARTTVAFLTDEKTRVLSDEEVRWWTGGFALVLDHVKPLPFVECPGRLGFFKVSDDVLKKLEG